MDQRYRSYRHALKIMNLETLNERRKNLCLTFAQRCSKHPTMKKMFPLNEKTHQMGTRNQPKFKVQFALNERLRKSPIIYMQNLLNEHWTQITVNQQWWIDKNWTENQKLGWIFVLTQLWYAVNLGLHYITIINSLSLTLSHEHLN